MPALSDRYYLGDIVYRDQHVAAYRARDQLLNRDVTVEILHEQYAHDADVCQRMIAKARAAALTNVPHVAALYDQQMIGERPFLVLEELAGPPLRDVAPLAPERAIAIVTTIAGTLRGALARRQRLPVINDQTVRISTEDRVQIIDLGLEQHPPDEAIAVRDLSHILALALGDPAAHPAALHEIAVRASTGQVSSIDALLHEIQRAQRRADTPTTVVPRAPATVPIEREQAARATQQLATQPSVAAPLKRLIVPALAVGGLLLLLLIGSMLVRGGDQSTGGTTTGSPAAASNGAASGGANASAGSTGSAERYVVAARGNTSVRVRNGPGLSFTQVASLPNGTVVEVIEGPQAADNYNWVRIRTAEVDGWCILEALRKE